MPNKEKVVTRTDLELLGDPVRFDNPQVGQRGFYLPADVRSGSKEVDLLVAQN